MHDLNQLLRSISQIEDDAPRQAEGADLLLYCPCPVKLVVKDRVEAIAAAEAAAGRPLTVRIPMGCTSVDPYDPLFQEPDPARLPGIIASIGFGDIWKRTFVERHLQGDLFQAVLPQRLNPLHARAGLVDPRGRYSIYGVTPYIFLVDDRKLGSVPPPRVWADVLDPRYKGLLCMCGDGDDMADAVVMNIHKEFGMQGLQALAGNAKCLLHSSEMAKVAGTNDPRAAAVFIIPAFFAASVRETSHVRMVWPEDGACASPLYFLAKTAEHQRLAPLINFFLHEFAQIESARWFIPMAEHPSPLPGHASLKWVGWDYVEQFDVNRLREELHPVFRTLLQERR